MATRYLKGTLTENDVRRDLVVDDGRLTHGFIVREMHMWPVRASQTGDLSAVLATKASGAALPMLAEDNRQIAWTYCSSRSAGGNTWYTFILPDEIVLEELMIIGNWQVEDFTDGINYLIILDEVTISNAQSALVLINNKSQDLAS